MLSMAIGLLWFLIGIIILCGVVFLVIWVFEQFIMPIPEKIKRGVWVIILILALIALLTILAGGGLGSLRSPFH
jgi:bacteriorhodopsin